MTAEEVNALPEKVRNYIMNLEANCDPSGMVRENIFMKEQVESLQKLLVDDKKMMKHQIYCAVLQGLISNPSITKDDDSMSISRAEQKAISFCKY